MKTLELNRLLEKYYKGESTEKDEAELRSFFSENNIPEGYEAEKVIFSYYRNTMEVPEPSPDFESGILAGIDEYESKSSSLNLRKFILPLISTAAALLIMAGLYFFFIDRSEPRNTYSDPEIAYAETMKILMKVSSELNQGAMALEPVAKINDLTTKSFDAINKPAKIIEKNLKNLDYLQWAYELTNAPVTKSIIK
jgi:hypothetical protein